MKNNKADINTGYKITRRNFIKGMGALGAAGLCADEFWCWTGKKMFVHAATGEDKWIPCTCMQCGCGPDPARARVVNGVLVKIEGNPKFQELWRNPSLTCAGSHGTAQKVYNPYRIKSPMKRTNPKKGMNEDPGFVEISWDEALNILVEKLKTIRDKGITDEYGIPRLAAGIGTPMAFGSMGHGWWPFWIGWGPVEKLKGGAGTKCTQTAHVLGEFWYRAFIDTPDYPHVNYFLSFGNNYAQGTRWSGSGQARAHADARARGMKLVMVAPAINPTGAVANEWIPIKVKTDAAFALAMIHVILHEMSWKKSCDIEFLKKMSNSPYLIGPHGNYAREPLTKKPLVWDPSRKAALPFDEARNFALEGNFKVKGIEIGADGEVFQVNTATPSFQLLVKHVKNYTPEWAQDITDVPAKTIRRVAKEFVKAATVGAKITIEGVKLPHRPVMIALGRGTDNGWGAHELVWAKMVLLTLMGAVEVPGGVLGCAPMIYERVPFKPDEDGFLQTVLHPTAKGKWEYPPKHRDGANTLTPLSGTHGITFAAHHLSWKSFTEPLKNYPDSVPEALILHHINPVASGVESGLIRKGLEKIPFTAVFAYTMNETNWYADLLLPESPDFEGYQVLRSPPAVKGNSVKSKGVLLRHPVIKPLYNSMDFTDIFTELAHRLGMLPKYYGIMNKIYRITGKHALKPGKKYSAREITDRMLRSHSNGRLNIDILSKEGAALQPVDSELGCYQHQEMVKKNIRYELPYQGKLKISGEELGRRLKEVGLSWWKRQAATLAQPLPAWQDAPGFYKEVYKAGPEHLWTVMSREQIFPGIQNLDVPWNAEVAADMLAGLKVLINSQTARQKGIEDGDRVCLESVAGIQYGIARLTETVRPDVLMMLGWGHYLTPVSKNLATPNSSELERNDERLICPDGSTSAHSLVRIYKV